MSDNQRVTSRSFAKRDRPRARMLDAFSLYRLRRFLWLPIVIGAALYLHISGTPHVLFQYQHLGDKRFKTSCTYVGLSVQTTSARNGKCPIVTFLHDSN